MWLNCPKRESRKVGTGVVLSCSHVPRRVRTGVTDVDVHDGRTQGPPHGCDRQIKDTWRPRLASMVIPSAFGSRAVPIPYAISHHATLKYLSIDTGKAIRIPCRSRLSCSFQHLDTGLGAAAMSGRSVAWTHLECDDREVERYTNYEEQTKS